MVTLNHDDGDHDGIVMTIRQRLCECDLRSHDNADDDDDDDDDMMMIMMLSAC